MLTKNVAVKVTLPGTVKMTEPGTVTLDETVKMTEPGTVTLDKTVKMTEPGMVTLPRPSKTNDLPKVTLEAALEANVGKVRGAFGRSLVAVGTALGTRLADLANLAMHPRRRRRLPSN